MIGSQENKNFANLGNPCENVFNLLSLSLKKEYAKFQLIQNYNLWTESQI